MVAKTGRGVSPIVVIAALVTITGLTGSAFAYVLWGDMLVPAPAAAPSETNDAAPDGEGGEAPAAPLSPGDVAPGLPLPTPATAPPPGGASQAPRKNATPTPPSSSPPQGGTAPTIPVPTQPTTPSAPVDPDAPLLPGGVESPSIQVPVDPVVLPLASADPVQALRDAPVPGAPTLAAPTPAVASLL